MARVLAASMAAVKVERSAAVFVVVFIKRL
jgi:hypothetical protein